MSPGRQDMPEGTSNLSEVTSHGESGLRSAVCTLLLIAALILTLVGPANALDFSGAKWVWHPNQNAQTVYLRKNLSFSKPVESIEILISADDSFELKVNGRDIGSGADWQKPQRYDVPRPIAREDCLIAVKASNTGSAAGVLLTLIARHKDQTQSVVVSDGSWLCTDTPVAGWYTPGDLPTLERWVQAAEIGEYPCRPWGQIIPESWESLSARLAERREMMQSSAASTTLPRYSEFKGTYIKPEYEKLYRSFVKLNRKTGLLECEGRVIRPFFTIYSQPKPDGGWIINIPDFDFDLLEKDFARMKQAGINVQPRFWNWNELLNYDGTWREVEKQPKGHGLPYFHYVYQIYDYFLDRAQAHGLYVNIEPSFYWGLHPEVVPPAYRGKILLHEELWDATTDAYSTILKYFSKRTVIVAVMVGEEDLVFDHSLDDPVMLDAFRRHLKRTFGTIQNIHRTWRYGYDYESSSALVRRTVGGRDVLWPEYPFVQGAFDKWAGFEDVRLPIMDYCRSLDTPNALLPDRPTYQQNLLKDPVWVEFMQMKENILISRLNDLAESFRAADPNHILFYSNAHDFNPAWHMLHCFDRGKLRWDVIGVGQHDQGLDPSQVPHWATSREYIQNVASYSPYVGAGGAYPAGFACGEGCGGKTREGTALYYPWWLADIVGGGGAFFHSYDWNHIAGRTYDKPTDYDDSTLDALADFLSVINDAKFSRKPDAEVLILRNKRAAYGMSAGYDFGNARYLASILCQLHIPFDILPDSDVTPGALEQGKINLNKYRFIFVPAQNQLLPSSTWQMLRDWITDPRFTGKRGLCFGMFQDQDCYFNPIPPATVDPAFEELTGVKGFDRRVRVNGDVVFRYARYFGKAAKKDELTVDFPSGAELGCFDSTAKDVERILETSDGAAAVIRHLLNANPVYTCGFYLGLAYDPAWGMEKEQDPYNTLTPLYGAMLESVGVKPRVTAPDNLAVYVSDDASAILLKERFGIQTDVALDLPMTSGVVYGAGKVLLRNDGTARVGGIAMPPYGTLVLRKAARLLTSGGTGVRAECASKPDGGLECTLSGKGNVNVTFELQPRTIYSVRQNGQLIKVFTADAQGRHTISLNLGNGSRPILISVRRS